MADVITIERAWVNKVKQLQFGTVLEIASNQRAKNQDTGEWETVGKTYYEVTLADGVSASDIVEGIEVRVVGTFKAVKWERDGKTGLNLKVRASEISPIIKSDSVAGSVPTGWVETW